MFRNPNRISVKDQYFNARFPTYFFHPSATPLKLDLYLSGIRPSPPRYVPQVILVFGIVDGISNSSFGPPLQRIIAFPINTADSDVCHQAPLRTSATLLLILSPSDCLDEFFLKAPSPVHTLEEYLPS